MMPYHRRAGTRGHDDVFGVAEGVKKMTGDLPGLGGEAGVERGLSAAGLGLAELALIANSLENTGHRQADFRKELVDQTGNK